MKPKRIILVRHGQSTGNIDKSVYLKTPDYAVPLSDLGKQQAIDAGKKLLAIIGKQDDQDLYHREGPFFYVSPYFRTRETFELIAEEFPYAIFREDVRLREQEWAYVKTLKEVKEQSKLRDGFGPFYYRLPGGESGADVFGRVSDFAGSLHRDFRRPDYPSDCVIIGHGLLNRLFLMRWFHWTVEEFEMYRNFENCGICILERNKKGRYEIVTELKKYDKPLHIYQRPIQLPHPKTQKIALQRDKE